MKREEISPLASSITLGEEIYRFIDDIQVALFFGIASFVWILVFSVLWVLGFPKVLDFLNVPLALVGGFFVLFSIPITYLSQKTMKSIKRWNERFIKFSYVLKFEILPSSRADPVERILEQLLNVFVKLGDIFENNQIAYETYLNAKVEGKKGSHVFDIYIGVENTDDQKRLREFHNSNGDLFVRRFAANGSVKESDLKTLFDEVSDVVRITKAEQIFRIIAISGLPFDKSALDFVKNKKNWIKRKSADLVQETSEGFRVIWVS